MDHAVFELSDGGAQNPRAKSSTGGRKIVRSVFASPLSPAHTATAKAQVAHNSKWASICSAIGVNRTFDSTRVGAAIDNHAENAAAFIRAISIPDPLTDVKLPPGQRLLKDLRDDYDTAMATCKQATESAVGSSIAVVHACNAMRAAMVAHASNMDTIERARAHSMQVRWRMQCTLNGYGPWQIEKYIRLRRGKQTEIHRVSRAQLGAMVCYTCTEDVKQRTHYFLFGCGKEQPHVICLHCMAGALFSKCEQDIHARVHTRRIDDVAIACPVRCKDRNGTPTHVCITTPHAFGTFALTKAKKRKRIKSPIAGGAPKKAAASNPTRRKRQKRTK